MDDPNPAAMQEAVIVMVDLFLTICVAWALLTFAAFVISYSRTKQFADVFIISVFLTPFAAFLYIYTCQRRFFPDNTPKVV